jgi:D-cysteine desulfhydrase
MSATVEGIHNDKVGDLAPKIVSLATATAHYLDLSFSFSSADVLLHEEYGTAGYGVITDAEREAIRTLARSEGIIADPVYTGRALAGLFDMIRTGVIDSDETVVFWHTGGVAGLFARSEHMFSV